MSIESLLTRLPTLKLAGITADSREVKPGFAFVAVKGGTTDGHDLIAQARKAGAKLVVGERGAVDEQVPDSREALALLADAHYGHPSRAMKMVGVTGTSGKTTTTYVVEAILEASGLKTGVLGTVNFRFGGKVLPSTHTTPGPVELQKLLAEMRDQGCEAVVMEVSSHALKQKRTLGIAFDAMIFTNLTAEHLDFHPDMEDYFQSKALLFTDYVQASIAAGKLPFAAVNGDDPYGARLLEDLRMHSPPGTGIASFGMETDELDLSGESLTVDLGGIRGQAGDVRFRSPLTGLFNAMNLLGAIAATRGLGIEPRPVSQGIERLPVVPGRLERVPNDRGMHVLVDYAHKSDALEKVIRTLAQVKGPQRLITVFGCGGDRDRAKRPVMGRIAVEGSDHVIVTSDNPRTERPDEIIAEILKGTEGAKNLTVEPDRRRAIEQAIRMAAKGDLVLIAGKGHEDYQIIGTTKHPFDDRKVAAEVLASL
jgi:UDP-N-acetylmuramoyl-L-alanyl-D-glutamate--2,6-diaminopimelate ligase